MNFCVIWKPPHDKKRNCPRIRMVISVFQLPIFFCSLLKKYTKRVFFQVWTKKIWQLKNQKNHLNLWRIAQLLMRGFLMGICHYCLKIERKNEKNKKKTKKKLKNPTTRKASSVTPIWRPLGQGSSLASLRTTFDTWLPPDPLKPP